jgi:predicted secreted protein
MNMLNICRQYLRHLAVAASLSLVASHLLAKTVTLTASDNGTSICLIEGDSLVITLPSSMAESYRWQKSVPATSPLTAMNDDLTPAKAPTSAAIQTFRFNAASVGESALTLNFARQKPGPAPKVTQTYSIQVSVTSGGPKSSALLGTYIGKTACADCSGIQTQLRLYAKGPNDFTDTIYVSTRTYLGGRNGDQSFTDRGEWSVMKGDAIDPNATVYALNPDDPQTEQYFLVAPGGATLTGLDKQMKPIDAPAMYQNVLKRVQ